jgi:hypothetical protein
MRARRLPLSLLLAAFACAREPAGGAAGAFDTEVKAFRLELADPVRTPVRRGLALDIDATLARITIFAETHRDAFAARFERELAALPTRALPDAATGYRDLGTFRPPAPEPGRPDAALALFDRDASQTVRRWVLTYLAIFLSRDLGMATSDVAAWHGFFQLAEPGLGRCGAGASAVEERGLCLDYGGLDVLEVRFTTERGLPTLASLRWWQRGDAAAPPAPNRQER